MDFSDLGGVPVQQQKGIDFSDLGGVPVEEQTGALESFGRGALRNFPAAQQVAAAIAPYNPLSQEKTYGKEISHLTQAAEKSKEDNGVAYGAGAVTGSLLPLALPVVGEGLMAAPIAGNAALGALQSASDTNLLEHPYQAAGEAAIGAGIGGAMGAAGKYFGGAKSAVAPEATEAVESVAQKVAPEASSKAAQATRTPGGILPDATPVSADFNPTAERIAASNWARAIGFTPRKFSTFAGEMGLNPEAAAIEGQKWSEANGLIKWMDHPGETLKRVTPLKKSEGKFIGDMMDKFGAEAVPGEEIKQRIVDLAETTANPNAEATLMKVAKRIDKLSERGTLNWHSLNELKGMIGEEVGEHPIIGRAYGMMAQTMEEMADATGKRIGEPGLLNRYIEAKRNYRMASLLERALTHSESKNLIGGAAGHNTLRGVLGQLAESMTGLPPMEQMAKNAMAKSAPMVKSAGKVAAPLGRAVKAGYKYLPSAAQAELTDALTSKFGQNKQ